MLTYLATALLFMSSRRATVHAALSTSCAACYGGRIRDGEGAGGAWYLHTPLPCTCIAHCYAPGWHRHASLGCASCRPGVAPTGCRCKSVAIGELSSRGSGKSQGCHILPSVQSALRGFVSLCIVKCFVFFFFRKYKVSRGGGQTRRPVRGGFIAPLGRRGQFFGRRNKRSSIKIER